MNRLFEITSSLVILWPYPGVVATNTCKYFVGSKTIFAIIRECLITFLKQATICEEGSQSRSIWASARTPNCLMRILPRGHPNESSQMRSKMPRTLRYLKSSYDRSKLLRWGGMEVKATQQEKLKILCHWLHTEKLCPLFQAEAEVISSRQVTPEDFNQEEPPFVDDSNTSRPDIEQFQLETVSRRHLA